MIVLEKIAEVRAKISEFRQKGLKIGFIPTMGALHEGHLSLVKNAKSENDIVIVSIFVNPTQFNNPDDLKNYPRTPDADFKMLSNAGVDLVFHPPIKEMYPDGFQSVAVPDFGHLETVLEGKFRPGHFKGMAQVVSRLFEIVDADKAYFGEKDFQQLAIVRELVRRSNFRVGIEGCPTVREPDGLAMSSRNLRLEPEMRSEATKISQALFYIKKKRNLMPLPEVLRLGKEMIENSGKLRVEYLEVADEISLQPARSWDELKAGRCLAAVWAGNIRLIDNVQL